MEKGNQNPVYAKQPSAGFNVNMAPTFGHPAPPPPYTPMPLPGLPQQLYPELTLAQRNAPAPTTPGKS